MTVMLVVCGVVNYYRDFGTLADILDERTEGI